MNHYGVSTAQKTMATSRINLSPDTKLRRLELKPRRKVVEILTINNRWRELAGRITRTPGGSDFMFSSADINTLEAQTRLGANPADTFLDHWSTSLRIQPTIQVLIDMLIESELYQAADCVSKELLGKPIFVENPVEPKTEEIYKDLVEKLHMTENDNYFQNGSRENSNDNQYFMMNDSVAATSQTFSSQKTTLDNTVMKENPIASHAGNHVAMKIQVSLPTYKYSDLSNGTENFCNVSVYNGGCKVGEGSYGIVYRAYLQKKWVAIKKLNGVVDKQFFTELEVLSTYKHENLLPLLGYSSDGPHCCLVYEYVRNGCLQERLACLGETPAISWKKRVAIAYYTACGINHLHTFGPKPLIHRDIKSANVLLDERLMPKIGDFGLARTGSSGGSSTIALTNRVAGTHIYMPFEAFRGEVTVKFDTFSYGVVLVEIITGLAPYDPQRKSTDLITYMEENCCEVLDIVGLLDSKAGQWDHDIAIPLYKIAKDCMETRSNKRPKISEVLPSLKELFESVQQS